MSADVVVVVVRRVAPLAGDDGTRRPRLPRDPGIRRELNRTIVLPPGGG